MICGSAAVWTHEAGQPLAVMIRAAHSAPEKIAGEAALYRCMQRH